MWPRSSCADAVPSFFSYTFFENCMVRFSGTAYLFDPRTTDGLLFVVSGTEYLVYLPNAARGKKCSPHEIHEELIRQVTDRPDRTRNILKMKTSMQVDPAIQEALVDVVRTWLWEEEDEAVAC